MYEKSLVPERWPGGGSFSVMQFTLQNLFDMHEYCRNWWTATNAELPLCRYLGVEFKFYQCQFVDYIVKIETDLPPNSNKLTYPATHPAMQMMSNRKIIVPSRQHKRNRKPYIKVKVNPPPQFKNSWYFTVDMYKHALAQLHISTTNLTNPFQKPNRLSNTVTFWTLNTKSIQNRTFAKDTGQSWPFKQLGTFTYYMYYYTTGPLPTRNEDIIIDNLIALCNPRDFKEGMSYSESQTHGTTNRKEWYKNWKNNWGNIFHPEISKDIDHLGFSRKSPEAIAQEIQTRDNITKWSELDQAATNMTLTPFGEPIFIPMQYNPEKDSGQDTKIYLLSNYEGHGWDPPNIPEIELDGFPIWLALWGYADFQKALKKVTNIDTTYILTMKTHFTQRPNDAPIVILNKDFTLGHSPYQQSVLPEDENKWYPMYQYQTIEQNQILKTGPYTPYTPDAISDNITVLYKFRWKWGGCPPKHITVDDPAHQIQYPIPRNQHETNSLQNPGQPPETMLYSFDHRHGNITTTALQRITSDWPIKDILSPITEPTTKQQIQEQFEALQVSEETQHQKEEEIKKIIYQLQHQQQCIRQRIALMLTTQ